MYLLEYAVVCVCVCVCGSVRWHKHCRVWKQSMLCLPVHGSKPCLHMLMHMYTYDVHVSYSYIVHDCIYIYTLTGYSRNSYHVCEPKYLAPVCVLMYLHQCLCSALVGWAGAGRVSGTCCVLYSCRY